MKKALLLVIFMTSGICLAQIKDSIIIKKDIYTVVYSEIYEQPLRVVYKVICSDGNDSRVDLVFIGEKGVKTSSDKDYKDNIYDKGHNAPSADFNISVCPVLVRVGKLITPLILMLEKKKGIAAGVVSTIYP